MISVTLGGVEIDRYTRPSTPKLDSKLGSRGNAAFTIHLNPGVAYRPAKLDEVYMTDTDTGEILFAGVLYDYEREYYESGRRRFALSFTDFGQYADRRNMFGTLTNKTAGQIVRWIIATYLAPYGVTEGTIEEGSTYKEYRFNGQKANAGLNDLADKDGFTWRIDEAKKLHFIGRESYAAPWNITDASKPVRDLVIHETSEGFRNRQYFRGSGNGLSDVRTETYQGDGALTEFAMRYRLATVPTIVVNGTAKSVGIQGVDSGKDWYWSDNSKLITQDEAGTVLTASDTLTVTYRGYFPIFVVVEDGDSITQHGLYESLDEDTGLPYLDTSMDKAETLLRKNGFGKGTVSYSTEKPGLRAGMVQLINLTDDEINASVLLTSVTASENARPGFPLTYEVEASIGERCEDWLDFYRTLAKRQVYELRPDEIISMSGRIEATCVLADSMAVVTTPRLVWDTDTWDGGAGFWQ